MYSWALQGEGQSATVGRGLGYTVGLALNPEQQGELTVCAGDRAPGVVNSIIRLTHVNNAQEAKFKPLDA